LIIIGNIVTLSMSEAQVETQEKEEIEGGERGIHLDERRED
jgi:hypothetical protein